MDYKSFNYGETIRSVIRNIPKEFRLDIYEAIENYGLDGIEPTFSEWGLKASWAGIKNCIDNCRPKKGAPLGNNNASKQLVALDTLYTPQESAVASKIDCEKTNEINSKTNEINCFDLNSNAFNSPKEKEKEKEKEKFKESCVRDVHVHADFVNSDFENSVNFAKTVFSQEKSEPAVEPQTNAPVLEPELAKTSCENPLDGGLNSGFGDYSPSQIPPEPLFKPPEQEPFVQKDRDTLPKSRSPPALALDNISALWETLRFCWNTHNVKFTADKIFINLSYAQKDRVIGTLKTYSEEQLLRGIENYFAELKTNPKSYVFQSIYLFFEKGIEFYV